MFEGSKQVMLGILGPLYLRIPVLVLAAFALSKCAEAVSAPLALRAAIFWGIALSLPVTVLLLFSMILLWDTNGASVKKRVTDDQGDLRLLVISLAGYAAAFTCGAAGGLLAPDFFPV